MEILLLKEDKVYVRSEKGEVFLIGCNNAGELYTEKVQRLATKR